MILLLVFGWHVLAHAPVLAQAPTCAPDALTNKLISNGSLSFSWNALASNCSNETVSGYYLCYQAANSTDAKICIATNSTEATVAPLIPFTVYNVSVLGHTSAGNGTESAVVQVKTAEGTPDCPPANLTNAANTSRTLLYTWSKIPDNCSNGAILGFYLCYQVVNGNDSKTCLAITSTQMNVTGLRPSTSYSVTAFGFTTAGNGPESQPVIAKTAEAAPDCAPSNFKNTSVSSREMTFSWSDIPTNCSNGKVVGYYLCYRTATGADAISCLATNTMSANITSLLPYTMYNVSVFGYTSAGNGTVGAVSQVRTAEAAPDCAPSNFKNTSVSSREMTFSWSAIPTNCSNGKVVGYYLCYRTATGADAISCLATNTMSANITSLLPYTMYNVSVFGYTSAGNGTVRAVSQVRTAEAAPECSPENLTIGSSTSQSLYFSWSSISVSCSNGVILGYYVCYNAQVDGLPKMCIATTNTQINVTGLLPYTSYNVTVFGRTAGGNGTESPPVVAVTAQAAPSCAPVGLNNTAASNYSLSFSWTQIPSKCSNGQIQGYYLCYHAVDTPDAKSCRSTNSSMTSADVTSLAPFTTYNVTVFGYTLAGNSSYMAMLQANTTEDAPSCSPLGLKTTAVSNFSLSFSWNKIPTNCSNGIIQRYQLCYQAASGSANTSCIETNASTTNVNVASLAPFTTYNVSVWGSTSAGKSPNSLAIQATTAEASPSCSPTGLSTAAVSNFSLSFSWNKISSSCANGIIQYYELCYQAASSNNSDVCIKTSSATYVNVTSLSPFTSYSVSVSGSTFAGSSPKSLPIQAKTAEAIPTCPPREIRIETWSATKMAFSWPSLGNCANGNIKAVSTCYYPVGPPHDIISSEKCDDGQDISNLKPYQKYNLTFMVSTSVGFGPRSEPITFMTNESTPSGFPSGIAVVKMEAYSLTLSWKPIPDEAKNGIITIYQIGYKTNNVEQQNEVFINVTADKLGYVLTGLERSTDYAIRIRGFTSVGAGVFSTPISVSTTVDEVAIGVSIGVVMVVLIIIIILVVVLYRRGNWPFTKPAHTRGATPTSMWTASVSRLRPMRIIDLPGRVTEMHADSNLKFHEDYEDVKELSPKHTNDAALMQENTAKNRYVDILPFDHSRVKLLPSADEEGSDYINASYMPGFSSRREFIAAQGPLPGTVDHFWRMIWEQNVSVVVMLTQLLEKGKRKCEQYWPEALNESLTYGDLVVTKIAESTITDYSVKTLKASLNDHVRQVTLLAYTSWPDFGCPQTTDTLLNFVAVFRSYMRSNARGPAVVHCSAGVGRTGTFICLDRMLQQIKVADEVDIFGTVLEMRDFRTRMVQTEDQYVYIHDCVKDALLRGYSPFYPTEKKPVNSMIEEPSQYINFEPKPRPTSRVLRNSSRASSSEGLVAD